MCSAEASARLTQFAGSVVAALAAVVLGAFLAGGGLGISVVGAHGGDIAW